MNELTRRECLKKGGLALAGLAAIGIPSFAGSISNPEEDVSPPEDLMREHGVLNRILLIYEFAESKIKNGNRFPIDALASAAGIIRRFVEDYHEKLEENFLFPRFEKANKLVDLVSTLRLQHQAGRRLTGDIENLAARPGMNQTKLADSLRLFIRMYRPHEAREDTVLFPALRGIVSKNEYDALGEDFEKKEHDLFGSEGFEGIVEQVAGIEKKLGIFDLKQFTPNL